MDKRAFAQHSAQAKEGKRTRTREGSYPLAKCLLCRARALLSCEGLCDGSSVSCLDPTNWKAGCGKTARPVWREGRPSGRPYPYRQVSERCIYAAAKNLAVRPQ